MQKILLERNIKYLMHFTREENLDSILQYGLLPRNQLEPKECIVNDMYRYDGCEDAVCTSIEFPNYKMFYSLRTENPLTNWVVLAIDSNVLLDFPCAFCETNAGSSDIYQVPIEKRMGRRAFLEMFKDISYGRKREDLKIPDYYPTNPQAEVLVFGTIPVAYIKNVFFDNSESLGNHYFPSHINGVVNGSYFFPRHDYRKWQ